MLIISHHLGQRTDIFPLSNVTAEIGSQIVAVFFFISGYGLCLSYMSKREAYLEVFLKKRLGKLLPKFITLTLGMVIFYDFFRDYDLNQQIIDFSIQGITPLPHSWFIYVIIYVYLSFYICSLFVKNPLSLGIAFTVSTLIFVLIVNKIIHFPKYWFITVICVNLGYFIAYYEKKITKILNSHKVLSYSSLGAILLLSFIGLMRTQTYIFEEFWLISVAISVYVIVRTLGFLQWKWLCQIGIISLEIYLIHGIPLLIGKYIGLDNFLLWLFTYGLSIPCALLLNHIFDLIEKWINRAVLKSS